MAFTDGEIAYLASQPLARLATAQRDGTLQNSPVSAFYNPEHRTIDVGGHNMATSQKFRNVGRHPQVALVVDDIVSRQPWQVRCLEIRGEAEAIAEPVDSAARMPGAIIRIHPRRIISWGIDPPGLGLGKRTVG